MSKRLLACFAHPDDEAFGVGGTLARYAGNGAEAYLVCATNGDVGEIADPSLATPETLAQVRQDELRCAAEKMGLRELIFLDYRDSGMAGTAENDDSRAFVNQPAGEVVARLVGIIRRLRPQVVVTFEPNGGYGHPDHKAIHRHTVAAFHAAGDAGQFAGSGPAWQPGRLFYSAIPRSFFLEMRDRLAAMGEDVSDFERFDREEIGWPDDQVDVTLDVAGTVDAKWAALNCHRTQFGPDNLFRRLPVAATKDLMSREYFTLAWPEESRELSDLFDGLAV